MYRLIDLRRRRNISQVRMGMELGVSQSSISAYEVGTRIPYADFIIKAANYFNVSADYILGLSDEESNTVANAKDEAEYVRLFNSLPELDKQKVIAYIEGLKDR